MKKYAVIDIGSNSVRLSVAEIGGDFKIIHENNLHTRLAEGMGNVNPKLKPVPVMRTALAVSKLFYEAESFCPEEIFAVATEAVRRADNAQWFIDTIKDATELEINVLEYSEEAYFDCVSAAFETGLSEFVLIDTGGGSTEIAIYQKGKVVNCTSFSWGAVTMTDMFSEGGIVSEENLRRLIDHVSDGISTVDWLAQGCGFPLVMTGGSLKCYGDFADRYGFEDFVLKMQSMTPAERGDFGIPERRRDTITAGVVPAMILSAIINPGDCIVCHGGLCRGILIDKAGQF